MNLGQPVISSFCSADQPQCVEVTRVNSGVSVRNTASIDAAIYFSDNEWAAFLAGAKNGEFDL